MLRRRRIVCGEEGGGGRPGGQPDDLPRESGEAGGEGGPDNLPPRGEVVVGSPAGERQEMPVQDGGLIQDLQDRAEADGRGLGRESDHVPGDLAPPQRDPDPHACLKAQGQRRRDGVGQGSREGEGERHRRVGARVSGPGEERRIALTFRHRLRYSRGWRQTRHGIRDEERAIYPPLQPRGPRPVGGVDRGRSPLPICRLAAPALPPLGVAERGIRGRLYPHPPASPRQALAATPADSPGQHQGLLTAYQLAPHPPPRAGGAPVRPPAAGVPCTT